MSFCLFCVFSILFFFSSSVYLIIKLCDFIGFIKYYNIIYIYVCMCIYINIYYFVLKGGDQALQCVCMCISFINRFQLFFLPKIVFCIYVLLKIPEKDNFVFFFRKPTLLCILFYLFEQINVNVFAVCFFLVVVVKSLINTNLCLNLYIQFQNWFYFQIVGFCFSTQLCKFVFFCFFFILWGAGLQKG